MAAPVPWETKLRVIQGYLVSKAVFMVPVVLSSIPLSSSPVSRRLVVVETINDVCSGVGFCVGASVGVAVAVGEGDGLVSGWVDAM